MPTDTVQRLRTRGGLEIVLDDKAGEVTISGQGSRIHIDATGITIQSAAKLHIDATTVELNAGMLAVNAGMSKFGGVVQCDTLVTNSVVATSYTPGAGNIW